MKREMRTMERTAMTMMTGILQAFWDMPGARGQRIIHWELGDKKGQTFVEAAVLLFEVVDAVDEVAPVKIARVEGVHHAHGSPVFLRRRSRY